MNKFLSIGAFALACASSLAVPAYAQSGAMPTCASGDPVVWENTSSKSKVYHMQGDSYYGKTKHGSYACKSAADSAGYHASATKSSSSKSSGSKSATASAAPDAMTSPAPAASASAKHHHKHHSTSATPSAAPSPAAT